MLSDRLCSYGWKPRGRVEEQDACYLTTQRSYPTTTTLGEKMTWIFIRIVYVNGNCP